MPPIRKRSTTQDRNFPKALLSMDDTVLDNLELNYDDHLYTPFDLSLPNESLEEVKFHDSSSNNYTTSVEPALNLLLDKVVENIDRVENEDRNVFESLQTGNVSRECRQMERVYSDEETTKLVQQTAHSMLDSSLGLENVDWQDNTLLNQGSMEVEPFENKKNAFDNSECISESCINLQISEEKKLDVLKRSILSTLHEETIDKTKDYTIGKDITVNHSAMNLRDENCLKLCNDSITPSKKSPLNDTFVANKKSRLSSSNVVKRVSAVLQTCNEKVWSSEESDSFYGLPEMVKNLIQELKGIDSLYQWQDECLRLDAVKYRKNLIYALPTSGGKTLVAEILMLREIICNKKNAIFILPFVAIVQEKVRAMAPFALQLNFLVEEYAAGKGQYPPTKRHRKNSIYMCTIEKGLGLVNSLIELNRLREIGIIVVDELHLLGEDGGRGATLEGLLTKVMFANDNVHIIGMSATIGNLKEVAHFLNADIYTQNFRPVEIKEYVKCESNIWLLDLQNEEIFTDVKKINYRYSKQAAMLDPDRLGGLVMDVVPQDSCLIFCPSRKNCENVALLLTKVLFKSLKDHKKKEKMNLLNALETEGVLCPILCQTIKFGVAYHHSGLTAEEKRLLEDAFKAGTLCVICCTSTLATGVNLPAKRVILRNPYVGNDFLTLSRYKQMIGRTGRAGMKEEGESILICKLNEIPKVKELLTSSMNDTLSTMHIEKERGINNLILSAILLSLATTRSELHKFVATTLLGIQQSRLNVNIKKITDKAIASVMKAGAIRIKEKTSSDSSKSDLTVIIPSQESPSAVKPASHKEKKVIQLSNRTTLEICQLGRAAMKGSIDLNRAHILYNDLKMAQRQLVLLDYLHLLYLVTPYDLADHVKPIGSIYYDVVTNLSEIQMETARVLGINEATVNKLRVGLVPKNVELRVIHRFYLTLMLYDLWNQQSVHTVAEKYQVNRGVVQNLLNVSSSFASSVVRFCEELDEFWAFKDLLTTLNKKLSYCCSAELESLMQLPSVKVGRARQLYKAGYKTLQSIATANAKDLQEKIQYLPKRIITQIIAAANLLLLEKVENLKDEAEEVLNSLVGS